MWQASGSVVSSAASSSAQAAVGEHFGSYVLRSQVIDPTNSTCAPSPSPSTISGYSASTASTSGFARRERCLLRRPFKEMGVLPKCGSSDIRWGSVGESAGGEEHAEPVVLAVAVAAGEASVQLDDPVDRFGAAVG